MQNHLEMYTDRSEFAENLTESNFGYEMKNSQILHVCV